ncbi:ABC transporter substrate-binding protein [Halobacteriales archaeon QS_1_68_20]|nr:MAG: ABC transporter substrate-binding protein [Halobacteriales archaeon QS_1_68_20]
MRTNDRTTGGSNSSRRRFLRAVGAAGLGTAVAGCLGGGGGPYEIGMVDALSGSLSPYGDRNQRGVDFALEDVNAVGIGEDERELDITVEDSESSEGPGVSSAQKLVNQDGAPLLIGAVSSGVSTAIYDSVTEAADVLQISQNSTSPRLSDRPDLMRMSPSGQTKGTALANLLSDDGQNSVAVTFVNNDYGQGLSEVFEQEFDGEVPYNQPHDQGKGSYSGEVSEMHDAGADAWLFITYAEEFTVMINEAYEQGLTEQYDLYGAESTIADEILQNTPEGSHDGMTGITESAPVDQQNYQDFKSRFEDEHGEAPTVWSAYAYDAVVVSALSIHLADEFEGPALKEVVRDLTRPEGTKVMTFEEAVNEVDPGGDPSAINYEGVSGPIDLDENGDPKGFYQIYHVEDHSYEFGDFITG